MNTTRVSFKENPENIKFAASIIDPIREPVLVIDGEGTITTANSAFYLQFNFNVDDIRGESIFEFENGLWNEPDLKNFVDQLFNSDAIRDYSVLLKSGTRENLQVSINGSKLAIPGETPPLYLLSFGFRNSAENEVTYRKLLNEILSEAPAFICTLRGPEHVFELANDNYLQLVAHRDIIGKKVKDALPEVENQGFIEMLDGVYNTGEAFIGKEIALNIYQKDQTIKESLLDFVYQPIRNTAGEVDGIFVHAIDVTEKVRNRKKLEESEKELRNWIDTVPVMIWLTNEIGENYYLNKKWYSYTGQTPEESKGNGWVKMVHPDDSKYAFSHFIKCNREKKEFSITYRLRTKDGSYRWVIDRGRPKYSPEGEFQGFIGSVTDIHEDKLKEQVIKEKELRTRSIVEEATVATGVYIGEEMKIELANDAMIEVWGKDRSVIGKPLREALPELEGQPFHDLLQKVRTTGETYWGEEDRVDLMRNGKIETMYFNFTYKPLRDGKGEIYGVLNMALDVTEMVASRNLLREREQHFRLLAELMPEKVMNTNANGEAIYFNQNWLEYTGLSGEDLKDTKWKQLIHPEEKEDFLKRWQESQESGAGFEMEVRLRNKSGRYLWHLLRAEAIRDEDGQIKMWIGTSTEIQRLKEEEKRKGDFLKMVSHELKTPVTSIKGYVQLLLNSTGGNAESKPVAVPLKPSLERIDNQIVRLTRLISEMLDLSRLEENQLELKKEIFSINELVDQTVQDIQLTNTQHQIEVFHKSRAAVCADKDRIGQVLINFITNAIKYSPESRYIEVHVMDSGDDKIAVSVRDKGIGIDKKYHRNIFKRFYRIGGVNEETYSGFGIGLYLANEIIERHQGTIEVKSKKGQGSDFCFTLAKV